MPATMKSLRDPSELVEARLIGRDRLAGLRNVAQRYAVAITPILAELIDAADPNDPIARQFIPDERPRRRTPRSDRRRDA
jgi:lysine 2,3-aminomutase